LTSDIIRVPSAEELKAGAKIEVLKPEDVEKQTRGRNERRGEKALEPVLKMPPGRRVRARGLQDFDENLFIM